MTTQDLDVGFRVLKLDDSNMKDVYYAAGDYTQDTLAGMVSNIKEDRTDLDLLFGCLLDLGLAPCLCRIHRSKSTAAPSISTTTATSWPALITISPKAS